MTFSGGGGAPELGDGDGGAWRAGHDWSCARQLCGWSLSAAGRFRLRAAHAADPGGGAHLFANGVLFVGARAAALHLLASDGPVGPAALPPARALPLLEYLDPGGVAEAAGGLVM